MNDKTDPRRESTDVRRPFEPIETKEKPADGEQKTDPRRDKFNQIDGEPEVAQA